MIKLLLVKFVINKRYRYCVKLVWLRGQIVMASDLQSRGHRFDSRPFQSYLSVNNLSINLDMSVVTQVENLLLNEQAI